MNRNIVIGITGASGALYAKTVVDGIVAAGDVAHLVISPLGRRLLRDELDIHPFSLQALLGREVPNAVLHPFNDVGSILASGGFKTAGMAIVPCSANTLGQITCGLGENLITRAAAVTLKERRRLIVVYREMPMTRIDLENALRLDAAGGVFCPANPGFYQRPKTVEEVTNMVAGKVLDLLDVPHNLGTHWTGDVPRSEGAETS